jgi:hypothetical protein
VPCTLVHFSALDKEGIRNPMLYPFELRALICTTSIVSIMCEVLAGPIVTEI